MLQVRRWQKMVTHSEEGGDGVAVARPGAKGSVRFAIFSRQRSASTTFVGLLNLHPNVTCRWEAFSNSFTATKMRGFLGMANRSEQLANVPEYMRRFWGACPTSACGFKLFNSQVRPQDKVAQIFTVTARHGGGVCGAEGGAGTDGSDVVASPVPVKRLLLERADIAGEFNSWRRAQSSGNWGTSPEAQTRVTTAAAKDGTKPMAFHKSHNTGCKGCDPDSVAKNQAFANAIGPARFAFQHKAWFRFARDVAPDTPLLHIYSENLTSSMLVCNHTMARVYAFLELPPLSENCNISSLQLEWPCNIETDPNCSMEKFGNTSALHE